MSQNECFAAEGFQFSTFCQRQFYHRFFIDFGGQNGAKIESKWSPRPFVRASKSMFEKILEKNIKNKPVLAWEREARKILIFRNMLESVEQRCHTANTFVYNASKN